MKILLKSCNYFHQFLAGMCACMCLPSCSTHYLGYTPALPLPSLCLYQSNLFLSCRTLLTSFVPMSFAQFLISIYLLTQGTCTFMSLIHLHVPIFSCALVQWSVVMPHLAAQVLQHWHQHCVGGDGGKAPCLTAAACRALNEPPLSQLLYRQQHIIILISMFLEATDKGIHQVPCLFVCNHSKAKKVRNDQS